MNDLLSFANSPYLQPQGGIEMDQELMSNEENYCFDIAGYLHVPGVLNRGEVEQLNQTIDKAGQLSGMLGWDGRVERPVSGIYSFIRTSCGISIKL